MTEEQRFVKTLETISDFHAMNNPASSFARIIKDIMKASPDCVIVGGIALSFYVDNPRATKDVDIVLHLESANPDDFKDDFERTTDKPFTLRHRETSIEVDLLSELNPVLNREILELVPDNVNIFELAGTKIRVAKPEIIIGQKISRAMHNTVEGFRDRSDILAIINNNPNLNLEKITPLLSGEERDMLDDLLSFGEEMLDQ